MIFLKAETLLLILRIVVFFIATPLFILIDVVGVCFDAINAKFKCKKFNLTFAFLFLMIISIEIFEIFITIENELILAILKYFVKSIFVLSFLIKNDELFYFLANNFVETCNVLILKNKKVDFNKVSVTSNPTSNFKTELLHRICFIKSIQQKNHDSRNRDFFFHKLKTAYFNCLGRNQLFLH